MDISEDKRFTPCVVDLAEIDDGPGPFSMSFAYDVTPLARSIETVGLVNAPIVASSDTGGPLIVVGQRRITALKSLGWEQVTCNDISESRLTPFELLRLNLYDNLPTRSFNPVEKAMVLARLVSHVSFDETRFHYMPLLDLPAHSQTLRTYLKMEAALDHDIKILVAGNHMAVDTALRLMDLTPESRRGVLAVFKNLQFNMNQQRQFVDLIIDISRIENLDIPPLLKEHGIDDILSQGHLNKPQKVKAILRVLRRLRLPSVVRAEERFKRMVSRLALSRGVRLQAPPFFETPGYCLDVRFRNGKELKTRLESLAAMEGLEDLVDPWEERRR